MSAVATSSAAARSVGVPVAAPPAAVRRARPETARAHPAAPSRPLLARSPSAGPTLGSELIDSALIFGLVAAVIGAVSLLVVVLNGWW